ncbi:MAG: hypothetical protein ACRDWI_04080 [Jiangellaceae bacterium]
MRRSASATRRTCSAVTILTTLIPAATTITRHCGRGVDRTIASAYSIRPTSLARVSAPVTWDELHHRTADRDGGQGRPERRRRRPP